MTQPNYKSKIITETRKKVVKSISTYNRHLQLVDEDPSIRSLAIPTAGYGSFYYLMFSDDSFFGMIKAILVGAILSFFMIVSNKPTASKYGDNAAATIYSSPTKAAAYAIAHHDTTIIDLGSIASSDSQVLSDLYDEHIDLERCETELHVEKLVPIVISHLKTDSMVAVYTKNKDTQ